MDYEASFNAGVAFRLAGKNDAAEIFYRAALNLRPEVTDRQLFIVKFKLI